jgi:hypothetical protein
MAWQILKDHIAEPDEPSRQFEVGTQTQVPIPALAIGIRPEGLPASKDGVELPKVKFKLFDDDGELYYEGRLHDDDECLNQSAALDFGMADAGCTTIKVLRDGEWVQEIG